LSSNFISKVFLCLQDTAGQEKFHALGPIYYRDADGTASSFFSSKVIYTNPYFSHHLCSIIAAALLVYDITDSDTFVRVTKWVKELKQMASKDIIMAIAANKSDLVRLKNIETQDAVRYSSLLCCICMPAFMITQISY
jgi:Ras-related protein Rab-21